MPQKIVQYGGFHRHRRGDHIFHVQNPREQGKHCELHTNADCAHEIKFQPADQHKKSRQPFFVVQLPGVLNRGKQEDEHHASCADHASNIKQKPVMAEKMRHRTPH